MLLSLHQLMSSPSHALTRNMFRCTTVAYKLVFNNKCLRFLWHPVVILRMLHDLMKPHGIWLADVRCVLSCGSLAFACCEFSRSLSQHFDKETVREHLRMAAKCRLVFSQVLKQQAGLASGNQCNATYALWHQNKIQNRSSIVKKWIQDMQGA